MLNVQLDKEDICTQIQGDNFIIRSEGGVNVIFTKEALKELVKDYVEITIGDTEEMEQVKNYAATQAIIEEMPHLKKVGTHDEIYCATQLPTFANDIKVNFDKGFDYFRKLIIA